MSIITTHYEFDAYIDRNNTQSNKWDKYPDCVPFSVAEMEFPVAPEILAAMSERVEHPFFGYTRTPDELREVIVQRLQDRYDWTVRPDHLLFCPGMVTLINMTLQVIGNPGDGVLIDIPAYGPFLRAPHAQARLAKLVEMSRVDDDDSTFHYEFDYVAFEDAIMEQTSAYLFCNPHNPSGRVFTREELERLAEICLRHNMTIVSDDIHCELQMGKIPYTPIATLAPEVERQTVTMMSPTKAFNLAGVPCSVAIVLDDELREKINTHMSNSGEFVSTFGYTTALAAYRDAGEWQKEALAYIRANRDYYIQFMRDYLPMLKTTVPEATYMAWIDCNELNIPRSYDSPQAYFQSEAKVALNAGDFFGSQFHNYVRLNFACPRSMLEDGLTRITAAVDKL